MSDARSINKREIVVDSIDFLRQHEFKIPIEVTTKLEISLAHLRNILIEQYNNSDQNGKDRVNDFICLLSQNLGGKNYLKNLKPKLDIIESNFVIDKQDLIINTLEEEII